METEVRETEPVETLQYTCVYDVFGLVIRQLRKWQNKSQGELAKACEIGQTTMCRIELGQTSPSIGTQWRLSEELKTTLSSMWARCESAIRTLRKRGIVVLSTFDDVKLNVAQGELRLTSRQLYSLLKSEWDEDDPSNG